MCSLWLRWNAVITSSSEHSHPDAASCRLADSRFLASVADWRRAPDADDPAAEPAAGTASGLSGARDLRRRGRATGEGPAGSSIDDCCEVNSDWVADAGVIAGVGAGWLAEELADGRRLARGCDKMFGWRELWLDGEAVVLVVLDFVSKLKSAKGKNENKSKEV